MNICDMFDMSRDYLNELTQKMDKVGVENMTQDELGKIHDLTVAIMHHEESFIEGFNSGIKLLKDIIEEVEMVKGEHGGFSTKGIIKILDSFDDFGFDDARKPLKLDS